MKPRVIQKDQTKAENLYEYDAGSGDYNSPYRFNAKELDPETGNYYYGARYYDPKISVWLSVDPMSSERSWLTPYNFVQNNPLMRVDPNGMLDGGPGDPNNEFPGMYVGPEVTLVAGTEYLVTGPHAEFIGPLNQTTNENSEVVNLIPTGPGFDVPEFTQPTIGPRELSTMEKWADSDNSIVQGSYEFANDLFQVAQIFDFGLLEKEGGENPFTGANFRNLDGSSNMVPMDNVVNVATNFIPAGKLGNGLLTVNKMNAAQFSSAFKGNLSKLSPSARGMVNRGVNQGITIWNSQVATGRFLTP